MGSYGSGGVPINKISEDIDKIQSALCHNEPYMINILSNRNSEAEWKLIKLLIEKNVHFAEASAFIRLSEPLVYYRLHGLEKNKDGSVSIKNRIIAKVSREEVFRNFAMPADKKIVEKLLKTNYITQEEAELSQLIPMADDITVEADSGGHTDGRPLVAILPAMAALRDSIQEQMQYSTPVRVGAGGGIGTGESALGAFQMGASYVVTGSVNQSCVESGTSDYVKNLLCSVQMADIVTAPAADMFEFGAKVEVSKKQTLFPQNSAKLYDYYVRYNSFYDIPSAEREIIENRILKRKFEDIWNDTKQYFEKINPSEIKKAEEKPKHKMALVFRWYLGNSSRWAVNGEKSRAFDMQIWCGQSMGAFNLWTKGTVFEKSENRKVADVAEYIMNQCAFSYMKAQCRTICGQLT